MWVVTTKFNAFYLAEDLKIRREKTLSKKWTRRWAFMTNCWRITKSKKLFYKKCSVAMRYVLVYGEADVNPKAVTFKDLENELKKRRKW